MTITVYKQDLPDGLTFSGSIAVDSETLGLNPLRDRLCVVQISAGDGDAHLVQLGPDDYDAAVNLKRVLGDQTLLKIFHFARFDVAVIKHYLGVDCGPVYCTKIASKLVRTYAPGHGLKDVVAEIAGVKLDKQQQTSNWAAQELSEQQQAYAASDVLYLHTVKAGLDQMLAEAGRTELAQAAFDFLPARAAMDLLGWDGHDIFAHS